MTREETLDVIKVMQAFADGQEIEEVDFTPGKYHDCYDPDWDWEDNSSTYRVKHPLKDWTRDRIDREVCRISRMNFMTPLDIQEEEVNNFINDLRLIFDKADFNQANFNIPKETQLIDIIDWICKQYNIE